jgi:hypothetical protein
MNRVVGTLLAIGILTCIACDDAKQEMDRAKNAAKEAQDKAKESSEAALDAAKSFMVDGVNVTKELQSWVGNLTSTLNGIADKASAEAVIGKLKESDLKLGEILASIEKMPSASKKAIVEMLKTSLQSLKNAVERVVAIPDVEKVVKPILDGMMNRINNAAS